MTFLKPDFSVSIEDAAKAHALEVWPNECCGLIVNNEYVPCENIAQDKENAFEIDREELVKAGIGLQAVLHSHTNGSGVPSAADMRAQIDTDCIFGIIPCSQYETQAIVYWGDFILEEPLIGRIFIHGISDCYALIRSYYWQVRGIKLPDFPRDNEWWKKGEDIYVQNIKVAGFTIIDGKDAQEGDCFIGKVRSSQPNHGGVLLGRGLGLHHLDGRLSRREGISRWSKYVTHYVRYQELSDD